jgi:hypothetical protein
MKQGAGQVMKTPIFIIRTIGRILIVLAIVFSGGCDNVVTLEKDDVVCGQLFPAGTIINLTDDGKSIKYCQLSRDVLIQGHNCIGKIGLLRWRTVFYPSGKLASIGLANTEVIDGIPCATGNLWNEVFGSGGRTDFYENGKLKYTKVAETIQYQGRIIKMGQRVRLKENGLLDSIE